MISVRLTRRFLYLFIFSCNKTEVMVFTWVTHTHVHMQGLYTIPARMAISTPFSSSLKTESQNTSKWDRWSWDSSINSLQLILWTIGNKYLTALKKMALCSLYCNLGWVVRVQETDIEGASQEEWEVAFMRGCVWGIEQVRKTPIPGQFPLRPYTEEMIPRRNKSYLSSKCLI